MLSPKRFFALGRLRRRAAGFSLVELLVVAGILAIVMAAVMGTLTLALRTTRDNSALVEANNNVRAVVNFIKNDLDNVGELPLTSVFFATPNPNPFLGAPAVYVRGGFLASRGFPIGNISALLPPDRIGNINPRLDVVTSLPVQCDVLSPIQAWTAATNGAAAVGTFAAPNIIANQGYVPNDDTPNDPNDVIPAATRYPNLRIYPGACDRTEVGTAYGNGSHQLITLQVNPVPVALRVSVPDPANPGGTIIQKQIFPVEATFSAKTRFSGSDLILEPEEFGGNLRPDRVAPNVVTTNPFVNPDDRLLAPRLRPFVDTLLLTYQYSYQSLGGGTNAAVLCVLGLVTGISGNNIILAANDLAGINPQNWRSIIQEGVSVTITRMRLSHYFIGWNGENTPPILFCRQGGLLAPLAFDIENFRLRFMVSDEERLRRLTGQDTPTPVRGVMYYTNDIGGRLPVNPPSPPAPPNLPPADDNPSIIPRSPLTTKMQVRMVEITVYGRTSERNPALIRADAAIPDAFNRGYFHVSERTSIGLRNLVPR
ncbi:MAG: type II secretion system GspH family protein [Chloracidobacterium sp.]|nr:type II secretion system GspH family protein [Chloracidobacterium sp.]MDW8218468.1 type II secretion system protein [Acidobacteriota bacterium]